MSGRECRVRVGKRELGLERAFPRTGLWEEASGSTEGERSLSLSSQALLSTHHILAALCT